MKPPISEQAQYDALVQRLNDSISQWRNLFHEAFHRRDHTAMWEAQAFIKDLEQKLTTLRQPNQPLRNSA